KLKQILDNRNGFKALKLQVCADFFDSKMLKVTQSPQNELEHVELQLRSIGGLSAIKAVVDAILWCCCPRSLNLTPSFQYIDSAERNQAVKYIDSAERNQAVKNPVKLSFDPFFKLLLRRVIEFPYK
nr:hypothetical protein [Tanacetum cinerariifolium]